MSKIMYKKPSAEVVQFENEDIITASNCKQTIIGRIGCSFTWQGGSGGGTIGGKGKMSEWGD